MICPYLGAGPHDLYENFCLNNAPKMMHRLIDFEDFEKQWFD